MKKLSKSQSVAMMWLLVNGPFVTAWWGAKPHTGWPRELSAKTYAALRNSGYVQTRAVGGWSEKAVSITALGRQAMQESGLA